MRACVRVYKLNDAKVVERCCHVVVTRDAVVTWSSRGRHVVWQPMCLGNACRWPHMWHDDAGFLLCFFNILVARYWYVHLFNTFNACGGSLRKFMCRELA